MIPQLRLIPFHPRGEVARIVSLYLRHLEARASAKTISEQSVDRARFYLDSFAREFGSMAVADCENSDLGDWLANHAEWASPHTKGDAIGAVVSCFRWASENWKKSGIKQSPYRRNKKIIGEPLPRKAIVPEQYRQIMVLARQCNGRMRSNRRSLPSRNPFRLALFFLWRSGARTCEQREARWSDLNWSGAIQLWEHKTMRATGEPRIVPLDPWVIWILRRVFEQRHRPPPTDHIFLNSRGRPWTKDFCKLFRKYARLAGVPDDVSTYSIRHGVCVDLLEHGCTDRETADILGHASTKWINWYGRSSKTRINYLKRTLGKRRGRLEDETPR